MPASLKALAARVDRLADATRMQPVCLFNHVRYRVSYARADGNEEPDANDAETHCPCGQPLTLYRLIYPW